MNIDIKDQNSLKNAASTLKDGGILIFPTDTVYGIGCALNEAIISKLYQIKNRPLDKPTAVLMSKNDVPNKLISDYRKYLAGRVTIIANAKNYDISFPEILLKDNKIGVRVPNDQWLQKLLDQVGPIVASSANLAGEPMPQNFSEISEKLLTQADLVIKSDRISSNLPSTVYDIELNKIIRN